MDIVLVQGCSSQIQADIAQLDEQPPDATPNVEGALLRKDYETILSFLDVSITKLAVAFKPPPSWDAIHPLLQDLNVQVNILHNILCPL